MSSCACGMAALAFGSPLWAVGRGCLFSPPLPQALAPRRPRRRPNAALTAVPGSAGRCAPTSVWVERSASIDIEADGDELFVYYSDLETLPEWCVTHKHTHAARSFLSLSSFPPSFLPLFLSLSLPFSSACAIARVSNVVSSIPLDRILLPRVLTCVFKINNTWWWWVYEYMFAGTTQVALGEGSAHRPAWPAQLPMDAGRSRPHVLLART